MTSQVNKYNRFAAVFLILVGIATGFHSWWNLHLGSMQHPDSGFQPFLASVLLVVCSTIWLMQNLGKAEKEEPFFEGPWLRPTLALVLMFLYGLAFERLGYVVATLLFMLAWTFLVEREKWLKSVLVSVITTAAMWLVFAKFLTVPLPGGVLDLFM